MPADTAAGYPVLRALFTCRGTTTDLAWAGTIDRLLDRIEAAGDVPRIAFPDGASFSSLEPLGDDKITRPSAFWCEGEITWPGKPPIDVGLFAEPRGNDLLCFHVAAAHHGHPAVAPANVLVSCGDGSAIGAGDLLRLAVGLPFAAEASEMDLRVMAACYYSSGTHLVHALPNADREVRVLPASALPPVRSAHGLRRILRGSVVELLGRQLSDLAALWCQEIAADFLDHVAVDGCRLAASALACAAAADVFAPGYEQLFPSELQDRA